MRLTIADQGEELVLSCQDSGIGIKEEDIPHLFQPFQQLDSGLARKREGTGLGLSICQKIIAMMGGSIEVHSVLGQGSVFTIRLPRQASEASNEQ